MKKQVVTIHTDGSMSGLERKKGQGVDLKQFGKAKVERVSLVEWHEGLQCWYVKIINSHICYVFKSTNQPSFVLTYDDWYSAGLRGHPTGLSQQVFQGAMYFHEYDDGVAAEVEFLDALRIQGMMP